MYCPNCGKEIPDKSAFCLHCGKPVATTSKPARAVTEWEYIYFSWDWKVNEGGWYPIRGGRTEQAVRLQMWGEDQSKILTSLQEYLDEGWEAVSEVGPMAYVFRRYIRRHEEYLSVAAFRVKLRRPRKSAIPLYHSKLVGKWQVVDIQTKGLYKLGKVLADMFGVTPKEYTFRDDNTYQVLIKNYHSGVYTFLNEQTIKMIPDPPMPDAVSYKINWNGNDLVMIEVGNVPVEMRLRKVQ